MLCLQDTPSLQDLKLMYYNLLIRYHEHQNSYIDICRCYRSIYEASLGCCIICLSKMSSISLCRSS